VLVAVSEALDVVVSDTVVDAKSVCEAVVSVVVEEEAELAAETFGVDVVVGAAEDVVIKDVDAEVAWEEEASARGTTDKGAFCDGGTGAGAAAAAGG
jgi:hypothetical protein